MAMSEYGGTARHRDLAGLTTGDDHPQYLLKTEAGTTYALKTDIVAGVLLSGGSTITASAGNVRPLALRAAVGQSANLLELQDSTNAVLARIGPAGGFHGPGANLTPTAAANVPLTVKGAAAQTASLTEWQDSGSVPMLAVTAGGILQRYDTRSTTNTYNGDGTLATVTEKVGTTTVKVTTLSYSGGNLTSVSEAVPGGGRPGKIITTTLSYTGSTLTGTTRLVLDDAGVI